MSIVEYKEKLDLSLFVILAPFKICLRVGDGVGSWGSAVNHVPKSSVLEDQGNHLIPVSVAIPIVIKEWNLILDCLR